MTVLQVFRAKTIFRKEVSRAMKPSPGFECSYSGLWSWDCSFWEPVRRAEDIGLTLVLGSASPKIDNRPLLSWNLSTLLIHNRGHLVRLGVLERS